MQQVQLLNQKKSVIVEATTFSFYGCAKRSLGACYFGLFFCYFVANCYYCLMVNKVV